MQSKGHKHQEDDVEQVDREEENTARSNDSGNIRISSKRSQLGGEAGTSRSLGRILKKRLAQDGLDHVGAQEVTILVVIKDYKTNRVCVGRMSKMI